MTMVAIEGLPETMIGVIAGERDIVIVMTVMNGVMEGKHLVNMKSMAGIMEESGIDMKVLGGHQACDTFLALCDYEFISCYWMLFI